MKFVSSVLSSGRSRSAKPGNRPRLFISAWWWVMAGLGFLPGTFRAWPADCVTPPAGLVAWWPGQGNANDIAGANNGTLSGGASFATGEVGQAFNFDGVNGYVEVANSSNLNPAASFSIEGWIFPRKDQTQAIMAKWADTPDTLNQRSYCLDLYPNKALMFGISDWAHQWDASFQVFNTTNNVFVLNTWSHVAAVYDQPAGARRMYVNGVKVAERIDAPITVTNSTARVGIGANLFSATGSRGYFDGLIDELSFYSTALSTAEIQAIHNAGSAGKCVPQPPNCIPLVSGLVGWWPAQGNANDLTGANNGTLSGGVTFTNGEVGQAFEFNPASGTVIVPDSPSLRLTNQLTIEAWINARSLDDVVGCAILSKISINSGNNGYQFILVGNTLQGLLNSPGLSWPSQRIISGPIISAGVWYHVAFTYDQSAMKLYCNGQPVATNVIGACAIATSPSELRISGADDHGYFDGIIDEPSVYNRALSAGEIAALYHAGSAGKCGPAQCVPPASGLVSWWPGEGNANDIAGTNNGVFYNGVGFVAGMVGQAISFNGTNSYVEVPDSPSLRLTNVLSIEFWVKRQDLLGEDYILNKGGDYTRGALNYGVTLNRAAYNDALAFTFAGGFRRSASIADTNWHHVAVVAHNGDADPTFYLDGVQKPVTDRGGPSTIALYPSTEALHIGAQVDPLSGWSIYSKAIVDELSIYNRALSAAEIQTICTAGSAGKCVSPPSNCIPPPSGLVGWWPGEGNAVDIAGENDGTLSNGAGFASGMVGQAFSFDGINDYVRIPKSASLDAPKQLTIDFWMKADPSTPIGSRTAGLVTSDFYGIEIGAVGESNVGIEFYTSTDGGVNFAHTSDPTGQGAVFPAGEWHHVAGTYDGAHMQLYIDGLPWGQPRFQANPISPMFATSFVAIGSEDGRRSCGSCIGSRYFMGLIDEVDVFNRVLSPSEIAAIYRAGAAGKCSMGLAPLITRQLASETTVAGSTATFTIAAAGAPPLSYQWRFGGTNIAGATGTSLILSNVQPAQAGIYAVQVTNAYGSTTSASAILTVTPLLCTPSPSGLVSWWRGEGDCLDAVGTNNGTLQNGTTFSTGLVGRAFSFDGIHDYVRIPRAASLNAPNQLTIDFWMKADPSQPIGSQVVGLVTSDFYGFEIGTAASKVGVVFFVSTDNGAHFVSTTDLSSSGAAFPAGEWHHIAGVYDGARVQLFLDGQALGNPAPVTGQISPMLANSFVAIGSSDGRTSCSQCFGSRYFKGIIDEVDFFNRALSVGEIAAIYKAGAAGKCLTLISPFISVQPTNQTVMVGADATFSAVAGGTSPLSYQWRFGGTNIAGATGTSLTLSNVQPAQAGIYAVQVINAYGSTNSVNAILTVALAPCAPPPSSLISWWRGEGDCLDAVGTNDGTLQNGATFAPGLVGRGFAFDGVNDYVKIPRATRLDVGGQVTIDFWMKADSSSPIGSRLAGLVGSDYYGMEIGDAPAGVFLFISTDNGAHFATTADTNGGGAMFPAGEWHHVAGTYDGTMLQFYLDGQPWGKATLAPGSISPMLTNSFVTIGSEDGRTRFPFVIGTRYFKGLLDEVDIFNRALSASEIAAIYHASVAGKCVASIAPSIYLQPSNQTVVVGANATFSASARGTSPLSYQWQFNGSNILGATATVLALTNVQPAQAGRYSVVITNVASSASSSYAVLTVNPPPPCEPPPSSLVSWWRGEGDCLDAVGTNNGMLQNGATFAPGLVGQGFAFDGVGDYVKIPRATGLDVGGQVTIDFWMKADPSSPIGSRLAGLVGSDYYGMEISDAPAGVFLFISTDNGAHFATTADTNGGGAMFPAGEWHHVAGTYDGTKLQFYLDGQPWGKATLAPGSISPMLTSSFVTIGSEDGRMRFPFVIGTRYFKGLLDEVDIFNRALSASEIAAIYNAGSAGKCRPTLIPHVAAAAATIVNGFVVGAAITDGGWGYTNTPVVRISGGGGSGARAVAIVSNGVVIAINILDAGSGYTNAPDIFIAPPFSSQPTMDIEAMSLLSFTNLAVGTHYQFQFYSGSTWSNVGAAFTAASSTFTQYVSGTVGRDDYRLATTPVPGQAYATAQVINGFVVGATVTSGGSGYGSNVVVSIVGGGGNGATATATVSGGVVIGITITDAGIGYTSTPTIMIAPPSATALWPNEVTQAMRLDLGSLSPYQNYQLEFAPVIGGAWTNLGIPFTPTSTTDTQCVKVIGNSGYLRVKYVP